MTTDEKTRVLEERAARLASLKQHPHWEELCAEFERKRTRNEKVYTAYLAAGDASAAQREFDRAQGFDAALQWVVQVVERAEDTLERVIREGQEKAGE